MRVPLPPGHQRHGDGALVTSMHTNVRQERKEWRLKMRNNTEAAALQFMMTDKRARKLVKSVARRMKTVVRDADGTVNEMRSRALAIHTTEELFVENRIEQVPSACLEMLL